MAETRRFPGGWVPGTLQVLEICVNLRNLRMNCRFKAHHHERLHICALACTKALLNTLRLHLPATNSLSHVQQTSRRHRQHHRTRPRRAHGLGGSDLLSGAARNRDAPLGTLVLDAWDEVVGPLYLAHRTCIDGN